MNDFSMESILFKNIVPSNNISNIKTSKSIDDCVYDVYKSEEELKFYETYTMINDYNTKQKLRMLNKLRNTTNRIHNTNINNSCESYIRSIEETTDTDNNTTQKVEKKKNRVIEFFKMIGRAIGNAIMFVIGKLKDFWGWLTRKNKNKNDDQSDTKTDKNIPEQQSDTKTDDQNKKNTDPEKEKRRQELLKKREAQQKEMDRLKNISDKNQQNNEPSKYNRDDRSYNKGAVKDLSKYKEAVKRYSEKYDGFYNLNKILGKKLRTHNILRIFKPILDGVKNIEKGNNNSNNIILQTSDKWRKELDQIVQVGNTDQSSGDSKKMNPKISCFIIFGDESNGIELEKIDEIKLISNPKILDSICDKRTEDYLKVVIKHLKDHFSTMKKMSDDYIKTCINIVGKQQKNETDVTKGAIHKTIEQIKELTRSLQKTQSKYVQAVTNILGYVKDLIDLRSSVRQYFEQTTGFKK